MRFQTWLIWSIVFGACLLIVGVLVQPREYVYGEWASIHDHEDYWYQFQLLRKISFTVLAQGWIAFTGYAAMQYFFGRMKKRAVL